MQYGILGVGQVGLRHFNAFTQIKKLKLAGFVETNFLRAKIFEKYVFIDDHKFIEGINKGIWNVSVIGLMKELISAIKEKRNIKEGSTFKDGLKNQMF